MTCNMSSGTLNITVGTTADACHVSSGFVLVFVLFMLCLLTVYCNIANTLDHSYCGAFVTYLFVQVSHVCVINMMNIALSQVAVDQCDFSIPRFRCVTCCCLLIAIQSHTLQ